MRGAELTPQQRAQVSALHDAGLTYREIQSQLGISLSTVSRTLARINERNDYSSRKRSGRPKVTTIQTDRIIHRSAVADPTVSAVEIRARLPTTVKKDNYLAIIQDKVPRFMLIRGTNVFMHDGAPAHTARIVKDWIQNADFECLQPWPGNSPDLNPIENC